MADYTFIRPLGEGNHGRYYLATPRRPRTAEEVAERINALPVPSGTLSATVAAAVPEMAAG